jgi:formylglycine-generating enzyme required for sulfatase activity
VKQLVLGENVVNLADHLSSGMGLSEETVFELAKQLASAIDTAHEKNQGPLGIHLKSILINSEGEIVLAEGAAATKSKSLIQQLHKMGMLVDTLPFLSPEQREEKGEADGKADTYAFGVVVYYLLTKTYPAGYFDMPSALLPDYKMGWDKLVQACLRQDPARRPALLLPSIEAVIPKEELKPVLQPQEIVRPEYDPDPSAIFQVEKTVERYQPKPAEIKQVEPLHTEMVIVKAGHYQRGSSQGARDELPRHAIFLDNFAIDIHPVSNEQFVRFLDAMGGEKDANNSDIIRLRESRIKRIGGKLNIESGYSKHPVVGVTWYGAIAYAKWIGKRLPTEAEWEVAASGGTEEWYYPTGNTIERSQANYFSSDTTAVMSYPPNAIGLYDMAGNVYEWCSDWYDYHYYNTSLQEPNNPKGPLQGVYRVMRGGCWKSLKEDLRCSHRHRNNPGTMNGTYGFRCAADVT